MAWYYGSDTNNATPFPSCPSAASNFYIGRIGGELDPGGGGFDTTAANAVGPTVTFAYWDLAGPGSSKAGSDTPTQWGTAQAQAFLKAWQTGAYQPYLGGTTFFIDIEPANGGWSTNSADIIYNQQVLIGALDYLNSISGLIGEDAAAGIYISQDHWNSYFGADFIPEESFVLWLTGTNCPSCTSAQTEFASKPSLGGYKTMIWQYQVSPGCGTQDLDITPYEGYRLNHTWTPVSA